MSGRPETSFDPSLARKRARTDADGGEANGWKRHPELYMPDGTMILLADDTVFRVYPGLLSKHSEVFSGMSSLSSHQPSDAETYDGCPLVRLTDNADKLAHFLENTMGANHFQTNQPTPFRIAAALLRLATKYMVLPLRRQAIEHFTRVFPGTFDEIGKRESYSAVFGTDTPHPFTLVTVFGQCQVAHLLPWAFYLACGEGFTALVNGATKGDNVILLLPEDNRIALLGWKSLHDETRSARRVVCAQAENCKRGTTCGETLRAIWLEVALYGAKSDALEQWATLTLLQSYEKTSGPEHQSTRNITPCDPCAALWMKKEGDRRRRAWTRLPGYFQLPPWDELLQES